MFCENCGSKILDDNKFCENCGSKVVAKSKIVAKSTVKIDKKESVKKSLFYSKNWGKTGFYVASIARFDILIDKDCFYIIKFPAYYASAIGLFLGLLTSKFSGLLGPFIGAYIGYLMEKNKRESFRLKWVDRSGYLISEEYKNNQFLKLKLSEVKKNISMIKNGIAINLNGESAKFKNKKEISCLKIFLEENKYL